MAEQMAFDLPDSKSDRLSSPHIGSIGRITWSYSRRGTLEQCPRRYYYSYYASNGRTRDQDPQARFLRRLQNRYERTGQILHLVISTFLRKARQGESWSTSRLCSWAESMFKRDCEHSKNDTHQSGSQNSDGNATMLLEFYYEEPEAEVVCAAANARLLSAIKQFAENPIYSLLRSSGLKTEALIECNIRVSGLPCGVSGRVDLAYRENSEVVVVDWKIGGKQSGDDSLQLATYGMWSLSRFGTNPGDVRIHKAFLEDGNLTTSKIDEKMLARARARIIQDAELMAALHAYGQEGMVDAFTPCSQTAICALCRFRKICEGRECLDVRD